MSIVMTFLSWVKVSNWVEGVFTPATLPLVPGWASAWRYVTQINQFHTGAVRALCHSVTSHCHICHRTLKPCEMWQSFRHVQLSCAVTSIKQSHRHKEQTDKWRSRGGVVSSPTVESCNHAHWPHLGLFYKCHIGKCTPPPNYCLSLELLTSTSTLSPHP